jgi:hypothetical protein
VRAQAEREAREQHALATAPLDTAPLATTQQGGEPRAELVEGHWKQLGIETWIRARGLEPGAWSEVFEEPGAFTFLRLISRDGNERAGAELFRVELARFPYLAARSELDQRVFDARLEIVDPEWGALVPARWRIPMSERTP